GSERHTRFSRDWSSDVCSSDLWLPTPWVRCRMGTASAAALLETDRPMKLFERFLDNHVLANILFVLILVLGTLAFQQMPRARDPDINFNWINIMTALPGASAIDVEKRITDPIEDVISSSVRDIKFVSSTSREGISTILLRFDQL